MKKEEQINAFLEMKALAIVGVSRDIKKFGNIVFKTLTKKGYQVLPVNPNTEQIDGVRCYKNIFELPTDVDRIILLTPKGQTNSLINQAIEKGIKKIWVQQGSNTPETSDFLKSNAIEIIMNECILMYAQPTGMHKFHRNIKLFFQRLFGKN